MLDFYFYWKTLFTSIAKNVIICKNLFDIKYFDEKKVIFLKIYGDRYNKYQEIEDIVGIIKNSLTLKKPITFSIEAEWGKGKTWILEKIEAKLNGVDLSKQYTEEDMKQANGEYFVIRHNAWEKDYCEEPLIGILFSLINQMNEKLLAYNVSEKFKQEIIKTSVALLENIFGSISKRLLGVDLVDVGKGISKKVKKLKEESELHLTCAGNTDNIEKDIQLVAKTLKDISKEIPIIFIVDELDRCLPENSIKTLERLHHIFGKVDNSVTIISVYRAQLENSIKQMFGNMIEPREYLRKFIDFSLVLNEGVVDEEELHKHIENLKSLFEEGNYECDVIKEICKYISSRDFENICETAELCHKISGVGFEKIPIICLQAELFLHAYRLAAKRENNQFNVSVSNANTPTTQFGKYIKNFLKDARESVEKIERYGADTGVYYLLDINKKKLLFCLLYLRYMVTITNGQLHRKTTKRYNY